MGLLSSRIKTTSTNAIFNHILGTVIYKAAAQKTVSSLLLIGSVIGLVVFGYIIYLRQVLQTEWDVLLGAWLVNRIRGRWTDDLNSVGARS